MKKETRLFVKREWVSRTVNEEKGELETAW